VQGGRRKERNDGQELREEERGRKKEIERGSAWGKEEGGRLGCEERVWVDKYPIYGIIYVAELPQRRR